MLHYFYNDSLSWDANLIFYLNLIFVIWSAIVNYKTSRVVIQPFRSIKLAMMHFSIIYALGYIWILFLDAEISKWSEVFRGVSLTVWPLIWIFPTTAERKFFKPHHEAQKFIDKEKKEQVS